jgi:hypothetical protein
VDTTQILKIQAELAQRIEVLSRDATCRMCGARMAKEVHHTPSWNEHPKHNPKEAIGLCSTCHRQTLQRVVNSDGELR